MRRFLRVLAVSVGVIVGFVVVGVAGLYAWTGSEIAKKLPLPTHEFSAPTDAASVVRGEHFVRAIAKCTECHGQDLGGRAMIDHPAVGFVYAPNLTPGGVGVDYTDASWERAIRHGLARDGRRLVMMPSSEYEYISDPDLGAVVAYLRAVPAVDRDPAPTRIGPVFRALYAAGAMPLFPADGVRHIDGVVESPAADSTTEYGRYLSDVGCASCHGVTYGGGPIPGGPPEWPEPSDLTPTGIGHYTFPDFKRALVEGLRPDGTALHPSMPVHATKLMTESEIVATWKYLRSLEPGPLRAR